MLLQKNSLRRLQSSTRTELARDLHDSLAQDLVAIGFQLDLLIGALPSQYRKATREIRVAVTTATNKVRKELFSLRDIESDYQSQLTRASSPLKLKITGDSKSLSAAEKRILTELVKNASNHSKGHNIEISIAENLISVEDDGHGMYGVAELVEQIGGAMFVKTSKSGTRVEISLP